MLTSRPRLRSVVLGLVALVLMATVAAMPATAAPQRPDPIGSDPFQPGQAYRGDFPDPTVGASAAVLRRLDHRRRAEPAAADLRRPADLDGAPVDRPREGRPPTPCRPPLVGAERDHHRPDWAVTWAPSVARSSRRGRTTFVAAYSVPRASDGRRCISLARSHSPAGPYVDTTPGPLVRDRRRHRPAALRRGPQRLPADEGRGAPDRLLSRRMNYSATMFLPGARAYLLAPRAPLGGLVVENPAMIRYRGRLYLFYSGNGYGSSRYATGYAICRSVIGPCTRGQPDLTSGAYLSGRVARRRSSTPRGDCGWPTTRGARQHRLPGQRRLPGARRAAPSDGCTSRPWPPHEGSPRRVRWF